MMRSMIAHIQAKPGQAATIEALLAELASQVRGEPGNVVFEAYRQADVPDRFQVLESYADEDAFQRHLRQPYVAAFNKGLEAASIGGGSTLVGLQAVGADTDSAPGPAVRGVDHIGLTVPDLDAAGRFLEAAFGAVTVYDLIPEGGKPMQGQDTERQLGLPGGARVTRMRLMRLGRSASFELFQIEDTPQLGPVGLNDLGLTHFGVYVDDMDEAVRAFQRAGGTLLSPPHALSGIEGRAGNAGVYGRAPWGVLIEMLGYPSGLDYPAGSRVRRWTPARR